MRIRIVGFGLLSDWLGAPGAELEVAEGSTVGALLARLEAVRQTTLPVGLTISVNQEFGRISQLLRDGDEVGLLPPVASGSDTAKGIVASSGEAPGKASRLLQ
jgi:molybdopterin converting factor small subunit